MSNNNFVTVLYGIGKSVIRMAYSSINEEKSTELIERVNKLNLTMYLPQVVMLAIAFYFGVCMPSNVVNFIGKTSINDISVDEVKKACMKYTNNL